MFPLTWNRGRQRGDDVLYWIIESLGSIGEKNLFKVGAFCRSRCQKFEGHLSALHMEECASVAEEEMTEWADSHKLRKIKIFPYLKVLNVNWPSEIT